MLKNIVPLERSALFKARIMPEPKTPAKPVPDPKYPTTVLGKPLQKPRVVLSPKEETVPKITDATRETQNDALFLSKVQAREMIRKPRNMFIEFAIILLKCLTLIRKVALMNRDKLLKMIRDLNLAGYYQKLSYSWNNGISGSSLKLFARSEEAEPTMTYPLLLNRPTTKSDKKNKALYFFCFNRSFYMDQRVIGWYQSSPLHFTLLESKLVCLHYQNKLL